MSNPLILSHKQKTVIVDIRDSHCKFFWECGDTYETRHNEVLPKRTIDSLIKKGIFIFKKDYPQINQDSWILNPTYKTFINSL